MALVVNDWTVLYHPIFASRFTALLDEAQRLKARLSQNDYIQHPRVKLAAAVYRLITEVVPANPDAPDYRLHGTLAKFRRAKGQGLPPRYRLFWVFSQQAHVIVFLYLNDDTTLRKAGARTDPYTQFERLVTRGEIGADFAANLRAWQRTRRE
jgi:toxin YhaV